MSSYYVLKIQYVNRPPETRNISAPVTTVGRESGDIVLNDPQTSGRHSEILFQNGQVRVRDVGSTNGTWFNGQRLTEFVLEAGQWFQCGQTTLQLMSVQGAQQAPARTVMAMGAPPPPAGMPGFGAPPPAAAPAPAAPQMSPPPAAAAPPMGAPGGYPPSPPAPGYPPQPGPPMGAPPMGAPPMGGAPMGGPPPGAPPMGAPGGFGGPPPGGPAGGPPPGGPPMGAPMGGPPMGGPGGFGGPAPGGAPMGGPGAPGAYGAPGGMPPGGAMAPMGGPAGGPPMGMPGGAPPMMSGPSTGGVRPNFQGTGGEFFVTALVGALLSAITLYIYMPWFICKMARYFTANTTLGPTRRGELRLDFTGQGGELFVILLLHGLLTAITLYIYMPWFMVKMIKFGLDNTTAVAPDGTRYRLQFDGTGGELFVTFLVGGLLSAITLYIYLPWFICKLRKVIYSRISILENEQPVGNFDFEGAGGELFVTFLLGGLLCAVTLYIYFPWFAVKLKKFYAANTRIHYQGRTFAGEFHGTGGEFFVINLVGLLLTMITAYIYFAWYQVNLWKFEYNNLEFNEVGSGQMPMMPGQGPAPQAFQPQMPNQGYGMQ